MKIIPHFTDTINDKKFVKDIEMECAEPFARFLNAATNASGQKAYPITFFKEKKEEKIERKIKNDNK